MNQESRKGGKVDRLVPKPMAWDRHNALGTTRSTCLPIFLIDSYV